MPELTTVVIDVTLPYEVYQSYQAELREAKAHVAAQRYRDAIGSAHRAWEYYGEGVLAQLGISEAELEELVVTRRQSFGLHDKRSRKYYKERTGDSLAAHPSWSKLFQSKSLRGESEHRGKPVSEAEANEAFQVRLDLMRHIDGVLARVPDVDHQVLKRATGAREAVV